jgi:hypothetical protein
LHLDLVDIVDGLVELDSSLGLQYREQISKLLGRNIQGRSFRTLTLYVKELCRPRSHTSSSSSGSVISYPCT